jgi:hypothetical protein
MEKWLKNLMLSALTAEVNEAAPALLPGWVSLHCSARLRCPNGIWTIHTIEKSAMTS